MSLICEKKLLNLEKKYSDLSLDHNQLQQLLESVKKNLSNEMEKVTGYAYIFSLN